MKKLVCFLMVLCVITLCPIAAFAQLPADSGNSTVNLLENAYIISADGVVRPVPLIDLGGGSELQPGDTLICPNSVYFNDKKSAVFNASCAYGDVAKLKVYRGTARGQLSTSLGYFTATQGKWYGKLTATIPAGTYYFTVENGGSHNIMLDSVTVNF